MTEEDKDKQKNPNSNKEKEETENSENQTNNDNKNKEEKKPGKKQSLGKETMKNSGYNLTNTIVSKAGGLILTIILARLLLPELYGLYNLVLSITLIASAIINAGVQKTTIRYVSEQLGSGNREKARSYFRYLLKIRGVLFGILVLILALSAKYLANSVFEKPAIFLPILAGCFLVLMRAFKGVINSIFISIRDFRTITINSVIHQSLRILLPLIAILVLSDEITLIGVFIALGIAGLISGIFLYFSLGKNKDIIKGKVKEVDKKRIKEYLFYITLTAISLKFFGQVDTLMLGRAVSAEFLGFYRAALNLVLAVSTLFAFGNVLLPVFTRITKERLERGFQKTFRYITMITVPATIGIIVVAKYFIIAIYGKAYITATLPLYALALIIFIMPISALYSSLFQAKEKPKLLTRFTLYSLLLNIVLNFVFIKYFPIWFNKGPEFAILGAGIATLISRGFYLFILAKKSKKTFTLKPISSGFFKFLFSALVMAGFLIFFKNLVDMNLVLGIIEILLGIGIYFTTLYLIKGLNKEDISLVRDIVKGKLKSIKETKRI